MPFAPLAAIAGLRSRPAPRGRALSRIVFGAFATLALLATTVSLGPAANAAVAVPRMPTGLPIAIEKPTTYVRSFSCDMRVQPGTQALASLLKTTYPTISYGLNRSCTHAGEHSDGRAIDWMATSANTTSEGYATAVINWLLKTDAAGNTFANARRLGVMYVIHDGRIWGSYTPGDGWKEYDGCATKTGPSWFNYCHRDHVHISLSWEGARAQTSFWSKKVAPTNYGPCRVDGLRWSFRYTTARYTPCAQPIAITSAAGATTTQRALVDNSGQRLALGDVGPGVQAIQLALGTSPTGTFGPITEAAVLKFKAASTGVAANAIVGTGTWKSLLAAFVPKAVFTAPYGR
jgi:hypothetical protein